MPDEPIFRFLTVRQPSTALKLEPTSPAGRTKLSVDLHNNPETDLQRQIKSYTRSSQGAEARRIAQTAKQNGQMIQSFEDLDPSIIAALDWLQSNHNHTFADVDFTSAFQSATGSSLSGLVESNHFSAAKFKLEDALVVGATLGESTPFHALAIDALKSLKLLEASAAGTLTPKENITIGAFLSGSSVVVPSPAKGNVGSQVTPPAVTPPPQSEQLDENALRNRFNALKTTRDDLATQLRNKNALSVTYNQSLFPAAAPQPDFSAQIRELTHTNELLAAALKEKIPSIAAAIPKMEIPPTLGADATTAITSTIAISQTALKRMDTENLNVLKQITGGDEGLGPMRTMALLDRELQKVSTSIYLPDAPSMYVRVAGGYIDKTFLRESLGMDKFAPLLPTLVAQCRYEVGIADLLLVKQTLKAYELADFAHVENALRGEVREREHRRLNIREEIFTAETERESERERNLQSTERNEMQSEATKQLRTELGVQAGLQVSGSYGPSVSFSASLNASFSTSVQESQRKATSFSREVSERTSERVRERVREERQKRVLEQIEELNRHKIDNATNTQGHLRGIYRWLNKVYDAQVLNYGKRMMYEFVIPEPAAFLIYTLVDHPPVDETLPPKPEPPTYNGAPLKPENLTRYNYQRYVAQYHITNTPTPPSEFKMVAHFDKLDGQEDPATFGRAAKLPVPDDYEALGAYINRYFVFNRGDSYALKVAFGGQGEDIGTAWGSRYVEFDEAFRGEISVAYGGFGLRAFGLGIDIFCAITEEGMARWQQRAYDAVIEGYERMRGDYEEKLAASRIAQGIQIIGRNPMENRRTEQSELKKWVIMILRGSPYLHINSFLASSEPALDIDSLCTNGKLIRFLENAFEWNNLSYVCYPYFWGRHARWASALQLTDPDSDFAAFLKAGAARVQVPVRPGFETAIAHFCETGAIPEGEATIVGGSMYVPIVEEIKESLGRLDNGVPYPAGAQPWEVRVPTSLVVLQDLNEISEIRDVLSGEPINLGT